MTTGPSLWSHHGGFFPTGLLPVVLVTSGVVFAYAAVELVGTAAGETAEPEKIMPRAINSVVVRIAIFYCRLGALLALLLPYTDYKHNESPFVTFFSHVGFGGAGSLMNVVVLTAAFSSLNAGLYSTGRILRSMAVNGSAPEVHRTDVEKRCALRRNPVDLHDRPVRRGAQRDHAQQAFEIVLNIAALGRPGGVGDDRALPTAAVPDGQGRRRSSGRRSGCHWRRTAATSPWHSWLACWC